MNNWKAYERLVAKLTMDEYDDSFSVIPNAHITGSISKRKRQIDVLIDHRYDSDLTRRIIIDAKNKRRPIDIKEVEAFEGLMKDVNAKRGILVCSNGHTASALRRAQQHIGIKLLSADDAENLDLNSWDSCQNSSCSSGLVLWDVTPGIFHDDTVTVQALGKCDECGSFHVWCWGCGNRKALGKEVDWQCACKGPWFWLTSIENEDDGDFSWKSNYLILVLGNGDGRIVDRRPL
jgi:hypothetical protein